MGSDLISLAVFEKPCFCLFFEFFLFITLKFSSQTFFGLFLLLFLPFVLLFKPVFGIERQAINFLYIFTNIFTRKRCINFCNPFIPDN